METAGPVPRRTRPPWWMWAVAIPFVCYVGILFSAHLLGPENPAEYIDEQRGWRVTEVAPGSAADRCGLQPRDLIVSWNGDTQLYLAAWHARAGRTDILEFERDGNGLSCELTLRAKPWRFWAARDGLNRLLSLVLCAAWLSLGGFVCWSRPDDTVARWGALLMAQLSLVVLRFGDASNPVGLGAFAPEPFWGLAGLAVVITGGTINSVLLTFAASFPRPLTRRGWLMGLLWLPAVVQLPVLIALYYELADVPLVPMMLFRSVLLLLPPVLLILNYRGLTDPNHRRRVRLLVFSMLIATVAYWPVIFIMLMPRLSPAFAPLAEAYKLSYFPVLRKLLLVGCPVCIAFAIVKHRLFDIRVMVRQGLQYAAARRLLLAAAPFFGAVLLVDLVAHADQPLRDVFADRGWLYLLLAAAGLAAHRSQRTWLTALDKRFFREHYDAQAILRGVVEEVRREQPMADLADHVVTRIDEALHPEVVAILSRDATDPEFGVLAQRPPDSATPPLHSESKLAAMLRLLHKPLGMPLARSGTDGLRRQLPAEDTEYLNEARFEWLYPISLGTGHTEGLLALGPRRSEEPYSEEDQELLATIAGSLALVLERPTADATAEATAAAQTEAVAGPGELTLAGRYRLRRPLGRGGMGLVYEAEDVELERRVAVKLMHRELTQSPEASARFRREAKAAAGLSHPNIVVVHDFGVDAEQGAYLVMERLQGSSLREELRRAGSFPPARVLEILDGVAAGVDAAHERGLVHRDLKPENIFLVKAKALEIPKVLDFGIAKAMGGAQTQELTTPGQLIGTPRYMSPEQLRAEEPSRSWDLWALAIIAYELLSGHYPFPTERVEDWQRAIASGQQTPLREHLPHAPEAATELFRTALAPEASARPASAPQLQERLRRTLEAWPT